MHNEVSSNVFELLCSRASVVSNFLLQKENNLEDYTVVEKTLFNLEKQKCIASNWLVNDVDVITANVDIYSCNELIVFLMHCQRISVFNSYLSTCLEIYARLIAGEDSNYAVDFLLFSLNEHDLWREIIKEPSSWINFIEMIFKEFYLLAYLDIAIEIFFCFLNEGLREEAFGYAYRTTLVINSVLSREENTFLDFLQSYVIEIGLNLSREQWDEMDRVFVSYCKNQNDLYGGYVVVNFSKKED